MYYSNKLKLKKKEHFYIISKKSFFHLLQSQRAPVKPGRQIHRILVLLYTHVPPFKHTFDVHTNPISIGRRRKKKIIDYSFDKILTTYLLNNHNFQNPVDMYIENYSVDRVEYKYLDYNMVVFDNYWCIDIDHQLNNPDKYIDNLWN
jgi:hypothetical protein